MGDWFGMISLTFLMGNFQMEKCMGTLEASSKMESHSNLSMKTEQQKDNGNENT